MNKAEKLEKVESEISADTSLPLRESNLVFGEGNPGCEVMFVGEGPGFHEDRLRRPFVGRGGQLLDQLIKEIDWKREEVYITNIIKRRPPDNRDPLPEEIEAYKPYLARQIEIIDPKVIVCLGRFAMNYFLPQAKIARDHGKVFRVSESVDRTPSERAHPNGPSGRTERLIFPVYHPAAALRSTETLNTLREDFKKLPKIVSGDLAALAASEIVAENSPVLSPSAAKKPAKNPPQKLF